MNAFERHGIHHLSASSLNTWLAAPSLWVLEKLLKHRGNMGASAHRGSSVESGVSAGLFNPDATEDECVKVATGLYDKLTALSGDPKREAERAVIPGMVREGLKALRVKGLPIRPNMGDQHKVLVTLEGVSVPFLGFLDFEYADEVIDTKTTLRVPSSMSDAHLRQATIYKTARMDKRVRFVYLSDKKSNTITLTREDYDKSIREITQAAQRLERFLALSSDAQELAQIIPHTADSFYFNDPSTRAKALEVYGY